MVQSNVLNTSFFLVVRIFLPVLLGVRSVPSSHMRHCILPPPSLIYLSPCLNCILARQGAKDPRGIVIDVSERSIKSLQVISSNSSGCFYFVRTSIIHSVMVLGTIMFCHTVDASV
jgi:hypothetical protein